MAWSEGQSLDPQIPSCWVAQEFSPTLGQKEVHFLSPQDAGMGA